MTIPVRGVTFEGRQEVLKKFAHEWEYDELVLEREPDNEYDEYAIKIIVGAESGKRYHIGYVPKELARFVSPFIDKGVLFRLSEGIITSSGSRYGAKVRLEIPKIGDATAVFSSLGKVCPECIDQMERESYAHNTMRCLKCGAVYVAPNFATTKRDDYDPLVEAE